MIRTGNRNASPIRINCPECGLIIDWAKHNSCEADHRVKDIDGIPVCFGVEQYAKKYTADPLYPLEHAIDVAERLVPTNENFRAGLDEFFRIREAELGTPLDREKELITRRTISSVNESIADASALLGAVNKPFPRPDRFHIDVGCGMGFGLASSSKSYFGQNVLGLDLSPHYLLMARAQLEDLGVQNVQLACADICDGWPIPLEQYDVGFITMEGVLEHIKNIPAFFKSIQCIKSFPVVVYLTVPYRWTFLLESHFNIRFASWLPRNLQDLYIARRLGVKEIDHVEFYSKRSLRKMLEKYFSPESIIIALNSDKFLKAHYLRCIIYIEGPNSFV